MNVPAVSVVFPAYNCEKYISKAIQSVLHQSFSDFELIIINDGSTDKTEFTILEFADPRIVYVKNQTNKGLVFTLNKGIELAQGKYIARMDADDICLPERFKKQFDYLEANKTVHIVATTVHLIDENDHDAGTWETDAKNTSPTAIYSQLPIDNCIAHPSVMGRSEVFKKYKYDQKQALGEDYDLWLRMAADKIVMHKLSEPLVHHRILSTSFTRTRQVNVFWKTASLKFRFTSQQLQKGNLNLFTIKTFFYGIIDTLKGFGKAIKKLFSS